MQRNVDRTQLGNASIYIYIYIKKTKRNVDIELVREGLEEYQSTNREKKITYLYSGYIHPLTRGGSYRST